MDGQKTTSMNELNELTDMESKVMNYLRNIGWYNWGSEHGFSDVIPEEIGDYLNIDMKKIRGVLSSLVKKQLVSVVDVSCMERRNFKIVYPTFGSYVLFDEVDEWVCNHFEWIDEAQVWLKENDFTGETYYDEDQDKYVMRKVA